MRYFRSKLSRNCTLKYLRRNHAEFHTIQRAVVLEEVHVGLVGLVRKHTNPHVFHEQSRARKAYRSLSVQSNLRLLHTLHLEKRRPQTVRLAHMLRRVDVLDPRGVGHAIEVKKQGNLTQSHFDQRLIPAIAARSE